MSTHARKALIGGASAILLLFSALLAAQPVSAQMDHMQHGMGGVDSGNITTGMSWEHMFDSEGTFEYHCHPHPFMTGQVIVSSTNRTALSGMVNVTIQGYAFHPAVLVIKPGTMVRWTNLDNETHTVTQEMPSSSDFLGIPWWQWGLVGLALVAGGALIFLKPGTGKKGQRPELAPTERIRYAWRRATFVWGVLFLIAGITMTYIVTESDDPCCHVQTPGLAFSAFGGISIWLYVRRRRRFEKLAEQGFNTHAFGDIEEEMGDLTKKLPLSYRERFREARTQYRRTSGERKREPRHRSDG